MAESDLIRGNVDTVILKVLYDGDRYGYDLIKQINARSGGQWEIKQPTLYACLKRLEKQGFISSYWDASVSNGGRRKYYSLTDSGREVFVSYKNEWERSRDLFGELITGSDPIMPVDDFSDVEEESYAVPKRRAPRPKRERSAPTPAASEPEPVQPNASDIADSASTGNAFTPVQEPVSPVEPEPQPQQSAPKPQRFVQQDFFTSTEPERRSEPEPQPEIKQQSYYDRPVAAQAADPHDIIQELYASTYTGGKSYSDVHGELDDEYSPPAAPRVKNESPATERVKPTEAAAQKPQPPAAPPAPEQKNSAENALLPTASNLPDVSRESLARREYKYVLSDLVDRFDSAQSSNAAAQSVATEQAAAAEDESGKIEIKRFSKVTQTVAELGNDVTVREHTDSAKEYTHKYYYYSNRLMMTHYTVMCALMFLLGLTLFLTFYLGLDMRLKYDNLFYVFAGLLPIAMFITAVIIFAGNPDRKKRINVNFRFSIAIRLVITVQVAVVIYCVNLIWGMPVSFSATYIPSLVLPLVYALFIPLSEVIFMALLKSMRYAVE